MKAMSVDNSSGDVLMTATKSGCNNSGEVSTTTMTMNLNTSSGNVFQTAAKTSVEVSMTAKSMEKY